jgi:hypothetical protein
MFYILYCIINNIFLYKENAFLECISHVYTVIMYHCKPSVCMVGGQPPNGLCQHGEWFWRQELLLMITNRPERRRKNRYLTRKESTKPD